MPYIRNPFFDKYSPEFGPEWNFVYPPNYDHFKTGEALVSFCGSKTNLCCAGISAICLVSGMHALASMQRTNYVAYAIIGSLLIASSYCCSCYVIKDRHSSNEQEPFDCVKKCEVTNVGCVALGLLTAALGFFTLSSIKPTDINAADNNSAYGVIGPLLITASLVCCFRNFIFCRKSENTSERTPLRSAEQRV